MLEKPKVLALLVSLIALVALLHFLGFYFEFYWRISWYDRVVHTLGGIWIVLVLFFLFYTNNFFKTRTINLSQIVIISLVASFIVGVLWELFEVKTGITSLSRQGYWSDTIGDVLSDLFGGLLGCWYVVKRWNILSWNQN